MVLLLVSMTVPHQASELLLQNKVVTTLSKGGFLSKQYINITHIIASLATLHSFLTSQESILPLFSQSRLKHQKTLMPQSHFFSCTECYSPIFNLILSVSIEQLAIEGWRKWSGY